MDAQAFEKQLKADGYSEIETKDYLAKPENEAHVHDFSARGLVLDGAFICRLDGHQVTFGPGDIFDVAKGIEHTEQIGESGARVLTGKKY